MRQPRIFISHSAKTAKCSSLLDAIQTALDSNGYDVLLDRERLREASGLPWRDTLGTWLELCDGAVILLDERARDESHWVRFEASVLAWRRGRDPEFVLQTLCVAPVTPESLAQGRLEPSDLAALQAVSMTAENAQAAIAALLAAFAPLKTSDATDTAIGRIETLVESYLEVDDALAKDAGDALGEDLRRWSPRVSRRRALARLLLGRGLPDAVEALRLLPVGQPRMGYVVELLATAWIDARAALEMKEIAKGPPENRALAINANEIEVSRMYLLRASGAAPEHPWVQIAIPTDIDEIDPQRCIALIDNELSARLGSIAVSPRRRLAYIRSAAAVAKGPIVILFPTTPDTALVTALRREYPHFTFFALCDAPPSGAVLTPLNFRFLRPPLVPERVDAAFEGLMTAYMQLGPGA